MLNIPPTGAEKLGAPGVGALKAVVADAPKLMLGVAEGAVKLNPVAGLAADDPNWKGAAALLLLLLLVFAPPKENVDDGWV